MALACACRAISLHGPTTLQHKTSTLTWDSNSREGNNYVPVDPDCHEDGVVCHFYKEHADFCAKGMNDPWLNCCTCGGGSTFNGERPTTTPRPTVDIPGLSWLPGIHSVEKQISKMEEQMKPFEQSMHEVYKGLNAPDFNAPPELEGNSLVQVNWAVFLIIVIVAGGTVVGWFCDLVGLGPKPPSVDGGLPGAYHAASGGRPPAWSTIMLILSYVLLVPGLTQVLFSFNIVVNVLGHRIDVQPEKGHVACTETVTGLVHLLEKTGSRTGAVLIVLYAVVVPVVKLLLLAVGEVFRFSSSEFLVLVARVCIVIVQSISKWACPDMFAYILLVHLVRLLHSDPLVLTAAKLDVGFSCFSVFCVCSTVSSLGISLPLLPTKTAVTGKPLCSAKAVQLLAGVIAAVFAIFFIAGLSIPCMSLRIDERQLYPPNGSVPYSAKPLVESLAIPDLLKSDISILSCTRWLIQEIGSGEANSLFALVMFGFCVIALPLADVVFLLLAASRLEPTAAGNSLPPSDRPCWFYSWAKVLRKLAMLDVSIMGVYVITFCMGIYKKQGIVLSTHNGVMLLIVAEVAHTLLYWLVSGAAEHAEALAREELIAYRAAAQEAGDPDADGPQGLSCCGLSKFLKLPMAMGPAKARSEITPLM
ncbi:fabB [Symbiodinium sp. CCMP2592]|nr:fabB [Symbiodinium sp. CCMP2592]